jgi:hypothetical protein
MCKGASFCAAGIFEFWSSRDEAKGRNHGISDFFAK